MKRGTVRNDKLQYDDQKYYKAECYTLLTNKFLEVGSAKHFGRSNERASTK